ncbi:MAG: glycosyltransferase [Nigerium sp.]|nr:glycosyltransferase [Nigerium sp.]
MPNQISGPNTSSVRLMSSGLEDEFEFCTFNQTFHAGGGINLRLVLDLGRQIRAIRPDLVHLAGLQAAGFHAMLAARLAGARKVLVGVHGTSRDAIGLAFWRRMAFHIAEWITLAMCDGYYTVCESARNRRFLKCHSRRDLGVVRNAAPIVDFEIEPTRARTRSELGLSDSEFVVAVSGRMVYDKGIAFVCAAVSRLTEPQMKFVFIGDGPYLDILKQELAVEISQGRVLLLGQRDDVLGLLSACDLFLFASLHENLSNALLEAVAIGLPILATDVGGNSEVVRHGRNGELIAPADVDAIVNGVTRLYGELDLRSRYSSASRQLATSEFTMGKHELRIREIYTRLMD